MGGKIEIVINQLEEIYLSDHCKLGHLALMDKFKIFLMRARHETKIFNLFDSS